MFWQRCWGCCRVAWECLGAFTAVAMHTHGVLTLGAVVTAMIASSGDEAFVMLALIRRAVATMSPPQRPTGCRPPNRKIPEEHRAAVHIFAAMAINANHYGTTR